MFRKVITASVLGFLLAGTLVSVAPANAATKISNGVLCKKANATTKVSGTVYKCTKNPIVNKTKYTWVSSDCISSNTTYTKLNVSYAALVKGLPATLAELDAKIAAANVKATEDLAKADAADAQIVIYRAKLVTFTAARATLMADTANAAKWADAIKKYNAAITALNAAISANMTISSSLRKVGRSVTTMQAQRGATVSSVTQAKAGVAQALSLRNLICQKGL